MRFRPRLHPIPGEKVLLVDDVLRSGRKLFELKNMIEQHGAQVVGLAVLIYQPNPQTVSFGSLPFYYLVKLDAQYFFDAANLQSSTRITGPAEKVWI